MLNQSNQSDFPTQTNAWQYRFLLVCFYFVFSFIYTKCLCIYHCFVNIFSITAGQITAKNAQLRPRLIVVIPS